MDGDACPGGGDLAAAPACRATAIEALAGNPAAQVRTRTAGLDRHYVDEAARLLGAAAAFVATARPFDGTVGSLAARAPLEAADAAAARADAIAEFAVDAGMAAFAGRTEPLADLLAPARAPSFAHARCLPGPPDGTLRWEREHDGGVLRCVDTEHRPTYHVIPPALALEPGPRERTARAHEALASEGIDGPGAVATALAEVAEPGDPIPEMRRVLTRHTEGLGLVGYCLTDPAVSDLYVSAPVDRAPVSVVCDGVSMDTNLRLSRTAAGAIASRLRRASGRPLSRATPTADAALAVGRAGRSVRAVGIAPPVSDGLAFAFRAGDDGGFTLPRLVANGTVPPTAAALCSLAVERGLAVLVAGPRGAGKTTTLGALCWELPARTRTIVMEDTPELPVGPLQRAGRDVQGMTVDAAVGDGDGPAIAPADGLRTALRLGEGALVVGEVRGEEAPVLFEAMRVGAGASAVLGTVHGRGAAEVRDRLVGDLDVDPAAVAATDLVVTLAPVETEAGLARRVVAVEEIRQVDGRARPATLFELYGTSLVADPALRTGVSRAVESLAPPGRAYRTVIDAIDERAAALEALAEEGLTSPSRVARAYAADRSPGGGVSQP